LLLLLLHAPEQARTPVQPASCERCVDKELRPPSNGFGLTLAGGIVTGLSVPWAVLSAFVLSRNDERDFDPFTAPFFLLERGFGVISAILSGACLLAGLPMLSIGLSRRSSYRRWMEEHRIEVTYDAEEDRHLASLSLRF
jgi:hypothetical protein